MIDQCRCIKCKVSYEILWDENEEAHYMGVEDDLLDHDLEENSEPLHCPFCGSHLHDDIPDGDF